MEYDNNNSGALFRAKDRKTDKHPEYTGTINIEGVEFYLSAWVKEKKSDGEKFFGIKAKRKDKQPAQVERQEPLEGLPF